jgi:hypothetical protein
MGILEPVDDVTSASRAAPTAGEKASRTVKIPASAAKACVLRRTFATIPLTLLRALYRPRLSDKPHPSALCEGRAFQTRPRREARSVPHAALWQSRMGPLSL